jgi:hypothetical protein
MAEEAREVGGQGELRMETVAVGFIEGRQCKKSPITGKWNSQFRTRARLLTMQSNSMNELIWLIQ